MVDQSVAGAAVQKVSFAHSELSYHSNDENLSKLFEFDSPVDNPFTDHHNVQSGMNGSIRPGPWLRNRCEKLG